MNKQRIDGWIPKAYEVLNEAGIAKDGKIKNSYRGQISTFGAAVMNGSLLAAISFFSDDAGASVHRTYITKAIIKLIDPGYANEKKDDKAALFKYVKDKKTTKEIVLDATIALKLAMNLYTIVE